MMICWNDCLRDARSEFQEECLDERDSNESYPNDGELCGIDCLDGHGLGYQLWLLLLQK